MTNESGIYIIRNTIDNRCYVGSAVSLYFRIKGHISALKNETKKANIHLLRFVKKYGIETLYFEVLELCKKEILIDREQYWINRLSPRFNICKIAGSSLGHKHSDETKEKLSIAHKKMNHSHRIGSKHSEETKLKMSIARKGRESNRKGVKLSEETKMKMSLARIGKKYGYKRKHTEETKQKISQKVSLSLIGNKRRANKKAA